VIIEPDNIPYDDLRTDCFTEGGSQQVIPFLGAGVSISARTTPDNRGQATERDPRIGEALRVLSASGSGYPDATGRPRVTLDEATRLYAEIALEMAFLIQQTRETAAAVTVDQLLDRLKDETYPPSGAELAEWLSRSARYGSFEDVLARVSARLERQIDEQNRGDLLTLLRAVAGLAGVAPASLPALSAFFEAVRSRKTLLERLGDIMQNKEQPTPTHRIIARAARWHLMAPRTRRPDRPVPAGEGHYLIMTTNYDRLMECALTVPYVVLTMSQKDSTIHARFGNVDPAVEQALVAANPPRKARQFTLDPPAPGSVPNASPTGGLRLAMLYKVHGCITDWPDGRDSIVISDNDYVTNISKFSDNDGVIPACVADVLSSRRRPYFLFLGYSLRDWNVRGMLKGVRAKRAGAGREDDEDYGDYSVIRNFGPLDVTFFKQYNIRILHEDLSRFSAKLDETVAARYDI